MTKDDLQYAILEALGALIDIPSQAEKFVEENIYSDGYFGFQRWQDICAKKVGLQFINTVNSAMNENIKMYEVKAKLDELPHNLGSLFSSMERAKKELT